MTRTFHHGRHAAALLLALLAACGGGSSDAPAPAAADTAAPQPPLAAGESAYDDPVAYSSAANGSIAGTVEAAAVTKHSVTVGGTAIAYTAHAGHLIARRAADGAAEASIFYVAYLRDGGDATTRPVTFFYNGGPGSATVWLHLGSFGPKRLAANAPSTAPVAQFPLVDNAESLIDASDLVFVDAVGTGLSTAIAPFTNGAFWGVDADAALFRDAIARWLAAFGRQASPRVLYGESYGGPRSAVLARRLQESGIGPDALVLQSPALDYNSNCGVTRSGGCSGDLPSYGAVGAWHGLASPLPADLDGYMEALRVFTAERYAPALGAVLQGGAIPADMPALLQGYTGIAAVLWQQQFNLQPETFQNSLVAGSVVGRYDGRMAAPRGSALASGGDPSLAYIDAPFTAGIASVLRDTLRYGTRSTYVMLSDAIASWDFRHAGRMPPDTVPDLAAALAADPALRILAISGYHDLATPFRITELDLARLGDDAREPRVQVRNYPGGHMSYLDDATRVRQKADLAAFYRGVVSAHAQRQSRAVPLAARPAADRAGTPPTAPQRAVPQQPFQTPLRDPALPPGVR